jgi:hypothetical protein
MKYLYQPLCFFIAISILFVSCQKEQPPKNTPVKIDDLETVSANVHEDGGVTLTGKINQLPPGTLQGYGFYISTDSLFANRVLIPITTEAKIGTFSKDINSGIEKGRKYFYGVYSSSTVNDAPVFKTYNTKSFISTGAKKPKFNSVLPLKAHIGDTLIITGKYFKDQFVSVFFGSKYASVLEITDSTFKCIVPNDIDAVTPLIIFDNHTFRDTISDKFTLYTPTIQNFTSVATFRETVTINGDHFSNTDGGNEVYFNNIKAIVTKNSRKQLTVVVPDDIEKSLTNIKVKAQLQTAVTATQFKITEPQITAIPQSANVGEEVTIQGKNFNPVPTKNHILFESNTSDIKSGTATQLKAEVPNGVYPRRKTKITLKLLDYVVTYKYDCIIKDKWIAISNVPFKPIDLAGTFTINNQSYVLSRSVDPKDNDGQYLWKFNASDFSWQKISIPFNFESGSITSNGKKAYLYITSGNNSNFWEYDPAGNSWTKKASYTADAHYYGTTFAIGNKVYVGLGVSNGSDVYSANNSFSQYDIATNTWSKVAGYPTQIPDGRLHSSSFVINGVAYVAGGAMNTGAVQFYSYTPGTDKWTRLADFPDARIYSSAFVYNNNGYVVTGHAISTIFNNTRPCMKYEPTLNKWTVLKDNIGVGDTIDEGYVFVNNGNVYVGGGGFYAYDFHLIQTAASGL